MNLLQTLQPCLVQDALDHIPTRSHGTPFVTTLHRCTLPVHHSSSRDNAGTSSSSSAAAAAAASRDVWCGVTVRSPHETSSPLDYIHLLANYYVFGCHTLRLHHAHMPVPYLNPSRRAMPHAQPAHTPRHIVTGTTNSIGAGDVAEAVRRESSRTHRVREAELSASPIPQPQRPTEAYAAVRNEESRSNGNDDVSDAQPPHLIERTAVMTSAAEAREEAEEEQSAEVCMRHYHAGRSASESRATMSRRRRRTRLHRQEAEYAEAARRSASADTVQGSLSRRTTAQERCHTTSRTGEGRRRSSCAYTDEIQHYHHLHHRTYSHGEDAATASPRSSFSPSVPRPPHSHDRTASHACVVVHTRHPSSVSHEEGQAREQEGQGEEEDKAVMSELLKEEVGHHSIATDDALPHVPMTVSMDSPTKMMATTRWSGEEAKATEESNEACALQEARREAAVSQDIATSTTAVRKEATVRVRQRSSSSHDGFIHSGWSLPEQPRHMTRAQSASSAASLHRIYSRSDPSVAYCHPRVSHMTRRGSSSGSRMSSLSIACTASLSRVSRSAPRLSWAPRRHAMRDTLCSTTTTSTTSTTTTRRMTNTHTAGTAMSRSASRETCSMPSSIATASRLSSLALHASTPLCLRRRRAQSVNNLHGERALYASASQQQQQQQQRYSECRERRLVCTMLRYSEESAAAAAAGMQENRPSVQLPHYRSVSRPAMQ